VTCDGAREFAEAIAALRALWLSERHDNETVSQWLHRTGRDKGVLA
jgi:sulfite reductase beta subunit-like hemoprotein